MKKSISILVAILMLFTAFTATTQINTDDVLATDNTNAVFVAVRWAPNGHIWSGDQLHEIGEARDFKIGGHVVSWGRPGFQMPAYPHCWTEFYLDVDANSGESTEENHWYAIVDTNGNLWFDRDGHFHDARYYMYADPWHDAYQQDPSRTDDNCKDNPFARVDPITSNNTQGPYNFPQFNISDPLDPSDADDENPVYFMDRSANRLFRVGYADLVGHNPGSIVTTDDFPDMYQYTDPTPWDANLELERFLDGRNPQMPGPLSFQEPPWDYDGAAGPAINTYDVNLYFFDGALDTWNYGEEWHADNTPGDRDTSGPDNMHEYLFGDFIYRKGSVDAGNIVTGMDRNIFGGDSDFPHVYGCTRLTPVVVPTAQGRYVRYPAGSVVIDSRTNGGTAGLRDPGDDLDVGYPVYRFPLSAENFGPMGNPTIDLNMAWGDIGSTVHLEAPWGYEEPEANGADPELFDYAVQQTPNGNVSLSEAIYMKSSGGSLVTADAGDTRLTNWGSGMMFLDRSEATGFVQPGDVLLLSEVLRGGCATPTYDISVETDLWEGMMPSVTSAALRSPNGEVTYRAQTIQKSTVLGPTSNDFAVPACTFEGIKLEYREYLGVEIWKDDGVNNMLDMGHLYAASYNVTEWNNTDDYHEGETGELFVGAQGAEVDTDIGLGHDTLTTGRQPTPTTGVVLPMSDFFQQTRRLNFAQPNGPLGAGEYGAQGHIYELQLRPDPTEDYFEVNPNGFGAPVRFFDVQSDGGYSSDALFANIYGCGEALYRDMDYLLPATAEGVGAFEISMGDIRLTEVTVTRMDPATNTSTVIVYHRDSVVAPGDQDVNLWPGLGPDDDYNNILGGNDLSPFITNYYDGFVMAHEVFAAPGMVISGNYQPVWLDWDHEDPYDNTNIIDMNNRYDGGEFIYDVGFVFSKQQDDKDPTDPGLEFPGEDNFSSWANPFGTVSEGWTRLTPVEYGGRYYECGSMTSMTDEWVNTIPVQGITYGRNGNRRFLDMEVIPGDSGINLENITSSDLKVEQTTEFRVSFKPGYELVEGHWDGPSWIPDEVGYVLLQGNGEFAGPNGDRYLNNVLYELTPDRPEARFHFTPYRGTCEMDPPGDTGDEVELFVIRDKGGVKPAPPDGLYADFFQTRWYYNSNYDLGQTPYYGMPLDMFEIPGEDKFPYPPLPDSLKNSYDCYTKLKFAVEPEDLIIESNKLCITTLDQRFPNLEFTLYDADNENDVNDPANLPFSIPFDNNTQQEPFHTNIVNYNCHGGGIDFMCVGAPSDPTEIDDPTNHKFIIQYNLDGTYFYWYWYEPTNTATLNNPQIPGALDPNDVVIGQEWTLGFPIDPTMDVKRTPVLVEDRTTIDDVDCSFGKTLCDYCKIDGMRDIGDITGKYDNQLRSDKLGIFDGTFGHIYQFGIPTYVTGYGQLTDADQGGTCLALAKPTDGSTHMEVKIYSHMNVFDYNSSIAHPELTNGAPYFVYDKMQGDTPSYSVGIDYCGTHDMKVYPPDPYVNFAEFHVIDHGLQFSKVHYTAGAYSGGYTGPLSPLEIPTPQIMAPYDPILRYIPTEFRCYPGGQTHAGRGTGQIWGNSGGPFGWNAYPAIWSRQINKNLNFEQYGKLGTEFFPLTDYMLLFVLKDGSGRHLSFDPDHDPDRRITRMVVSGPFARPKELNHITGSVVTPYEYNQMTQVPIQYDFSGEIVIDETNWRDYEMVEVDVNFNGDAGDEPYAGYGNIPNENDQYRDPNPFIEKLDNLNFASIGYMNTIGAGQYENTDNVFVIDELTPWQPGKILVYVTLYDGTFKMYQDCCTSPPTDGIDVHALGIEYTISEDDSIRHIPLGIDNKIEVKLTEEQPYHNDIAEASIFCNDAYIYLWQDRGVARAGEDFYAGAGDAWVTNPPGSSRFYYGRDDGNAAQFDVTWDDQPIDINGNGIVAFAERETEIIGSYNIATNTWSGGLVDARTFQRNNGMYIFELTEDNGCQITDSGLDFGGEEGIGDEPDHIISDKELLPVYITAYKYGDDNADRAFSPYWDMSPLQETYQTGTPAENQMRYSHEVYLAGQMAIPVEPEDTLIVNLASPNKLTAGITPELISPDTPLMIEVKDEYGNPVDLSYGIEDMDGNFVVEDDDIWTYLFRDPHPDNRYYFGQDATLPQYYYLRTDLHNTDETLANNESLYSVRTIDDDNDCEETISIPFRPIETNFSNKENGQYIFRGFCANDITVWNGEPGDPEEEEWLEQHKFVVYVYTPDRTQRGTLVIDIESPQVEYEITNVENLESTQMTPGDPDFVMTAADNRVYKIKATVKDAEGRLVKGVTKGVSVCGGGVKSTARFTPFVTRPESFEFDFNPCEGSPCGEKVYPHIGFDFNASGKTETVIDNIIEPGNEEFYQMGGFFLNSDISYQICIGRVASGYVEYNTTNHWYQFDNTWETDYVNPADTTAKGWAINMTLPPNLEFMTEGTTEPEVRGWGLGSIYNYDWFTGALFTDVDRNGNLDYHDSLGLDVNAQTEFYLWAEDVFNVGGLVGSNVYCNNLNEADLVGYPPRDRTDPREMHRRFKYTVSNDQTFYLDWEAWPDHVAEVAAPYIEVRHADDMDRPEYSKEKFWNAENYDLVYNVPNHMVCLVYPADYRLSRDEFRDVPMHTDGIVMFVGNQHETTIFGKTYESDFDPNARETTSHYTPTGTGEGTLEMFYMSKNKWYVLNTEVCCEGPLKMDAPEYYSVYVQKLDVYKGLAIDVKTLEPLTPKATVTLYITVTEMGAGYPINGANVKVTGQGLDISKRTNAEGKVEIEVSPASTGFITISAESDENGMGEMRMMVGSDKTPPMLVVHPPTPVTNQKEITVTGTTDAGVVITINGKKATVKADGTFNGTVNLQPGKNPITIIAKDGSGNMTTKTVYTTLDTEPASVLLETKGPFYNETEEVTLKGRVEEGCTVVLKDKNGGKIADASVVHDHFEVEVKLAAAPSKNEFVIEATDPAGNVTSAPYVIENVERIEIEVVAGKSGVVVNDELKALPDAVTNGRSASHTIFEYFGANVTANTASGMVEIKLNGSTIVVNVGSAEATLDGKAVNIQVAPTRGNSSILVPVRTIANALGITTWVDDGAGILHLRYDRH